MPPLKSPPESRFAGSGDDMPETPRLILKHPDFDDWEGMYRNLWCREECARYMLWDLTYSEEDAKARMERSIAFQQGKPIWFVYEKDSGQPIGFGGIDKLADGFWSEAGIALGSDYWGKGYGKEILNFLTDYAREHYGAVRFQAACRSKNRRSRNMILGCGFRFVRTEELEDPRNGESYTLEYYEKEL